MSVNKKIEILFKESETETNKQGNEIKRGFYPNERYMIDFDESMTEEGWLQFDTSQDAPYFGFWVNPKTLQTLCYCEGDWTLCTCKDVDQYNAEITSAINFYGEGYEFKTFNPGEGWTEYRQDREKFLIK